MEILVIGYGNTLRRDDGLGPIIAERIAALHLPGVRCLARHQLTPELAEPMAAARAVLFLDAAPETSLRWEEVTLAPHYKILTHASDPGALCALAETLYGRSPKSWILHVPAQDFALGEELSDLAEGQVDLAVSEVRKQAEKIQRERS